MKVKIKTMHKITAIVGRNGSGKTLYVEKLRRDMASDKLRYIAFSDSYGPAVDKAYYLQLRWNQHDIDQRLPMCGNCWSVPIILPGRTLLSAANCNATCMSFSTWSHCSTNMSSHCRVVIEEIPVDEDPLR